MADEQKEKKLIIDEDWKVQAQKEKEKIKEEAVQTPDDDGQPELPDASFTTLVSMLATQAFYSLGLLRTQETKDQEIEPDFAMARYHIDLLAMLEVKSKGNLDSDEQALLSDTLSQLRMVFVQLSK